jgi:hypothetical protein
MPDRPAQPPGAVAGLVWRVDPTAAAALGGTSGAADASGADSAGSGGGTSPGAASAGGSAPGVKAASASAREPSGHSLNTSVSQRPKRPGGGAPAVVGRDAKGRLMMPAITLHALVPGIRARHADGRQRLIDYLVQNFDELVYV